MGANEVLNIYNQRLLRENKSLVTMGITWKRVVGGDQRAVEGCIETISRVLCRAKQDMRERKPDKNVNRQKSYSIAPVDHSAKRCYYGGDAVCVPPPGDRVFCCVVEVGWRYKFRKLCEVVNIAARDADKGAH